MKTMESYQTTDLAEATFLRIEGYQLLKVEFDEVLRSAVFCFRNDGNLTETAATRYKRSSEGRRIHDVIRTYKLMRDLALSERQAVSR